jgi:hypothetical protein
MAFQTPDEIQAMLQDIARRTGRDVNDLAKDLEAIEQGRIPPDIRLRPNYVQELLEAYRRIREGRMGGDSRTAASE